MPVAVRHAALALALAAFVIAIIGLLHALFTSQGLHMWVHELEGWMTNVAYKASLIILAAAGVVYLARKS